VSRCDLFFGNVRCKKIDSDLLDEFVTHLRQQDYANGSTNRSLSALRAMLHYAKTKKKVGVVPDSFPIQPEAKPRKGFFELAEYRALLASLPDHLKPLLAIGFWTGMRSSEIRNLRWTQIDLANGLIVLNPGETKNDSGRSAPVPRELAEILRMRHATRPKHCPWVCYRIDRKGEARKVGAFAKAWRNRCVKLGLGTWTQATDPKTGEPLFDKPRGPKSKPKPKMIYEGKLFHDLRRSGIRNMIRSGISQTVAMVISGHRTVSVFQRYNITTTSDIIEARRKLERFEENSPRTAPVEGFAEEGEQLKN
jgi:integrase